MFDLFGQDMKKLFFNVRKNILFTNAISNYVAAAWLGIVSLALTPIYLKVLGPTQWGIVSICIAVQAFMFLIDAGLAQIMPRDIAKEKKNEGLLSVFLTYNYLYIIIAAFGWIVGYLSLPYIVSHWFNPPESEQMVLALALKLLLTQFVFQLVNNSNLCYWYGIQKQYIACARQILFFSLKHALAIIFILVWEKNAISYQLAFLSVTVVECLFNRYAVIKEVKTQQKIGLNFDFARIKRLFKESGVLSLAILLGMFTTQIDKLVLSKQVGISIFGYYAIIAFLGAAFLQLQYPLMRAFLPRLTTENNRSNLGSYVTMLKFVMIFCIMPTLIAIIFSEKILLLWLHNVEVATLGALTLRLILVATILNAFYNVIYQKIIISGDGRFILLTNLICMIVVFPLTYFLSKKIGIQAGGIAWLSTASIQLLFGVLWIVSKRKAHEKNNCNNSML